MDGLRKKQAMIQEGCFCRFLLFCRIRGPHNSHVKASGSETLRYTKENRSCITYSFQHVVQFFLNGELDPDLLGKVLIRILGIMGTCIYIIALN